LHSEKHILFFFTGKCKSAGNIGFFCH